MIGGWGEAIHLFYLDNERQDTTPIALPNIYGEHQVHSAIFSCSYSPDGKRIIGGSRNGILYQFGTELSKVIKIVSIVSLKNAFQFYS